MSDKCSSRSQRLFNMARNIPGFSAAPVSSKKPRLERRAISSTAPSPCPSIDEDSFIEFEAALKQGPKKNDAADCGRIKSGSASANNSDNTSLNLIPTTMKAAAPCVRNRSEMANHSTFTLRPRTLDKTLASNSNPVQSSSLSLPVINTTMPNDVQEPISSDNDQRNVDRVILCGRRIKSGSASANNSDNTSLNLIPTTMKAAAPCVRNRSEMANHSTFTLRPRTLDKTLASNSNPVQSSSLSLPVINTTMPNDVQEPISSDNDQRNVDRVILCGMGEEGVFVPISSTNKAASSCTPSSPNPNTNRDSVETVQSDHDSSANTLLRNELLDLSTPKLLNTATPVQSAILDDNQQSGVVAVYEISPDGALTPVIPNNDDSPLALPLAIEGVSPGIMNIADQRAIQQGSTITRPILFPHENVEGIIAVDENEGLLDGVDLLEAATPSRTRNNGPNQEPKSRKRTRNPDKWKDNVNKSARQAGLEYTTRKGIIMPAKQLGLPCKETCRFKCQERVTYENRLRIFTEFYSNPSQDKKWDFITRLVTVKTPEKKAIDTITGKHRATSRTYHFRINFEMIKVCQTMFLNTLLVSEQVLATALDHKLGSSCVTSPDRRGKHFNRPKRIPEEVTQSVIDHINAFPRVASHFCRANSTCEYLEESVGTVANMYRLYETWAKDKGLAKLATYKQYLDIFNFTPGLNIKFHKPKKDQCETCFAFNHMTAEEKTAAAEDHAEHLRKKDIPQSLKRADREKAAKSAEFCAAVFDLQKVLLTPKCEAGILFYHRKFSNYNFTIWDLGKKEGHCYVWNECIAKRGSNEIATFVLDFLVKKAAEGFKEFSLYADNCSGQNKNRMVYSMLMHAAAKLQVNIVFRFFVTGHTMNEGDSMHARIETESKNCEMFVPEDWWVKIENAKKDGKSFIVKRVIQEDVLDFHDFVNNRSEWKNNTDSEEVSWSTMGELRIEGSRPGIIQYKYDMETEEFQEVDTKCRKRGHPVNIATYAFPKAYHAPLPIAAEKKKDLVLYCDKGIIPSAHHEFYRSLKTTNIVPENDFYSYTLRSRK